jgi:hypothetical protein
VGEAIDENELSEKGTQGFGGKAERKVTGQ